MSTPSQGRSDPGDATGSRQQANPTKNRHYLRAKAVLSPTAPLAPPWWILSVLLVSLSGCQAKSKAEAEPRAAAPSTHDAASLTGTRIEAVVLRPTTQSLTLKLPGEVQGERDATLSSALGGYIENVHVKEGDRVKQGALLARVDSQSHTTRLVRAQIELEAAQRELGRAQSLKGTIPQVEIDSAEDRVASAKATLRELQLNVERSLVKAPFSGVITRSDAEVGEVAAPGSPLFRLVKLDPVHVSVSLSDRDIALAKEGMQATVELDARSGLFHGRVLRLSRAAELKTRSFEALIEVENADEELLPGMIAQVTLSTDPKGPAAESDTPAEDSSGSPGASDAIIISQDWLVTDPKGIGVFVVENGTEGPVARWRPVQLGPVVHRQVKVREGLNAGDALIIVGHRTLSDGDPVIIHRQGTCCQDGRPVFGQTAK